MAAAVGDPAAEIVGGVRARVARGRAGAEVVRPGRRVDAGGIVVQPVQRSPRPRLGPHPRRHCVVGPIAAVDDRRIGRGRTGVAICHRGIAARTPFAARTAVAPLRAIRCGGVLAGSGIRRHAVVAGARVFSGRLLSLVASGPASSPAGVPLFPLQPAPLIAHAAPVIVAKTSQ